MLNYQQPFESLAGKVCVITGGAGLIGEALARGVASVGGKLALLGRNGAKAEQLARQLQQEFGIEAIGIGADVTDRDSLELAREMIHTRLGKISFLVNCAGGNHPDATASRGRMTADKDMTNSFFELTESGFKHVMDLNYLGTILPTQTFAQDMVENGEGVVVNLSSVSAFLPVTKVAGYSAAKAAINNFTKWLAVHFAETGVRVNAISPGFFLTEQNRFLLTEKETGELTDRGRTIISQTPMKRFGEVEELAGTLLYLLSPMAKFVTGEVVLVDGGFTAFGRV
ncbi:MAG: SDR family oxidoreductase [Bacteroidia bacterium]|jgi:NAD(P)-dependent dehydrogenase (short-subunit alcohol dehydrogenase family)|nr:SDR family oxidoreductase [Bacteroidia bacterium]